jgi:DNA-directed RNA polymerase specialized sigma24 family protein
LSLNCKHLSDYELLERIKDYQDDNAYNEFVDRFYTFVNEGCIKKCELRKIDVHVGKQIAHETFERVKSTKSFKKEKLNGCDSNSGLKGWLYRISSNLFYDYHNSLKEKDSNKSFYLDEIIEEAKSIDINDLALKRDITMQIIKKLNQKEVEVVCTDLEYKRSKKYLPDEVNEALANRLGVKKDSIRKIRERAVTKLKAAINEING